MNNQIDMSDHIKKGADKMVDALGNVGKAVESLSQKVDDLSGKNATINITTNMGDATEDVAQLTDAINKLLDGFKQSNKAKYFQSFENATIDVKTQWNALVSQIENDKRNGTFDINNLYSTKNGGKQTELLRYANAFEALGGNLADINPQIDEFVSKMREAMKAATLDKNGKSTYQFNVSDFKEAFVVFKELEPLVKQLQEAGGEIKGLNFSAWSSFAPQKQDVSEIANLVLEMGMNAQTASESAVEAYEKQGQAAEEAAQKIEKLTQAEMERKLKAEHERGKVNEWQYDFSYDEDKLQKYADKLEELKQAQEQALYMATAYQNRVANGEETDRWGNSNQESMERQIRLYHEYADAIEFVQEKLRESIQNYSPAAEGDNAKELNALVLILRDLHGEIVKISSAFQSFNTEGLSTFLSSIKELGGTNSIIDAQQFQELNEMFKKIESSLDSVKNVLVDVGDGEEFSPLLKVIGSVQDSVKELSESVSKINLNVNMDLGSEVNERLNQKVSKSMNRQLEAYRSLFNAMKSTGKTNKEMLRFFEPEDASISEIIGAYKEVISKAEKQFGKDTYKSKLGKGYDDYLKEVRNATDQFNRATSKKKTDNPLGDLFGKNELMEISSQLGIIADKLDQVVLSATEFKNTFTGSLNVTSSIDDVEKLTNKVKELEEELSKVQTSSTSTESRKLKISSRVNTPQVVAASINATTPNLADESNETSKVADSMLEAANAKEKFAQANKLVEESAKASSTAIKTEADAAKEMSNNVSTSDHKLANQIANKREQSLIRQQKESEKLIEAQAKASNKALEAEYKDRAALAEEMAKGREQAELARKAEEKRQQIAENNAINKELRKELELREKNNEEIKKGLENSIKSSEDKVSGYQNKLNNILVNRKKFQYNTDYNQEIAALEQKIAEFNKQKGLQIVSEEQANELNRLEREIKEMLDTLNAHTKNFDFQLVDVEDIYKQKEAIAKILNENTAMPAGLKELFRSLSQEYQIVIDNRDVLGTVTNVSALNEKLAEYKYRLQESGKTGNSVFTLMGKKIKGITAQFFAMYLSVYDLFNLLRRGYQNVAEIDKQMIELEKVSDMSGSRLEQSFRNSAEAAKDLGSTISDVISATADWSRMGYDADAAEELARVATLYKNVGDGIDVDTANESLISTLQGFQLDASEAESIVDKFNEVANNYAIDSAGIGEALKRSAASFNVANTDLSESIALITATNTVVQDPESVGTMWKTVSARIRGAKTELEDMGEDTEGMVESTSKLRDLVKGMTGFDIMEDENTFKSIYEIIVGIGKEWENLNDVDRAGLLEALAGKRAGNSLAAALQNYELIEKAYATAEGSAGSAMREQEKWEQGLEAKTNKLKASLEELSTTVLDSDFLGGAIDAGRTLIEVFTALIDKAGVIPTVLAGVGTAFGVKSLASGNGRHGKTSPVSMSMPLAMSPIMDT